MECICVDSRLVLSCLKFSQVKVGMKSASSEDSERRTIDIVGVLLALNPKVVVALILMPKKGKPQLPV